MPISFRHVRFEASPAVVPEMAEFYGGSLGFRLVHSHADSVVVEVGETTLEFRAGVGSPFYHVAFLVPGDRFAAALDWARERVELLPDEETGDVVFDFANWGAEAAYFHDPAGSILELIAHHGTSEGKAAGAFTTDEVVGISEVGVVGDPPSLAADLERVLALEMWDGSVIEEGRLAFVGEKARTLILARAGRSWLPTGRPAEAHPVEIVIAGRGEGEVRLETGGCVRGSAHQQLV